MPVDRKAAFEGYVREDGRVGIRNEVWIVNTVGCVNGTAKTLERMAQAAYGDRVDGIHCFVHPYGCSQLGEDHKNTQKLLASMVRHPNAGAVLVLSLGCEKQQRKRIQEGARRLQPRAREIPRHAGCGG